MPNIKSAKKRLRQNIALRERNRASRSFVRNRCKNVIQAVKEGNVEDAERLFRVATKALDQAGSRQIIHKNAAARKKSRLSAQILKLKTKNKNTAETNTNIE
ncbi:MAG: 30S ribosomal protein S20 [Planctomycetaceae bacterium]|jgi:small subunit ribosomal protein S20|nr:30S ribosomal protein S20 [Planctomycetaceae bacterium]